MRALVQRVTRASVTVDGEITGQIEAGLCVLVGVTHADRPEEAAALATKIWHLRVFDRPDGRMDLPVADVGGGVLVVSQFTLYGDTRRGRRPSWIEAAPPEQAERLIEVFCEELRRLGAVVSTGRFRADMAVELVNDGPVTLMLEVTTPAAC